MFEKKNWQLENEKNLGIQIRFNGCILKNTQF
jgi:hypothetical protein